MAAIHPNPSLRAAIIPYLHAIAEMFPGSKVHYGFDELSHLHIIEVMDEKADDSNEFDGIVIKSMTELRGIAEDELVVITGPSEELHLETPELTLIYQSPKPYEHKRAA